METIFGRTTGNIQRDFEVYGQENLLAREKYNRIREKQARKDGVPTLSEGFAQIAIVITVFAACNTGNPLGDYVDRILSTENISSTKAHCPK